MAWCIDFPITSWNWRILYNNHKYRMWVKVCNSACYLWPWLDLHLAALQYVMSHTFGPYGGMSIALQWRCCSVRLSCKLTPLLRRIICVVFRRRWAQRSDESFVQRVRGKKLVMLRCLVVVTERWRISWSKVPMCSRRISRLSQYSCVISSALRLLLLPWNPSRSALTALLVSLLSTLRHFTFCIN